MDRNYSTFTHHVNNAKETISAEHINTLQTSINNVEKNVVGITEESFVERALFILENNNFISFAMA